MCGLLGGLFVAIMSLGLLPLFEYLFEVATDFRLVELCNLNHPLLKELILKAPPKSLKIQRKSMQFMTFHYILLKLFERIKTLSAIHATTSTHDIMGFD